MLHLKFRCLKHNVCLCCSHFLHPLLGRMFGHHTPTHIARLCTLISGLLALSHLLFIIIPDFFLFLPSSPPTQPNHPLKCSVLLFSRFSKLVLSPISLQKCFCMPSSSLETTCSPHLYNHSPISTQPYRGLDCFLFLHFPFHNKTFLWNVQLPVPKSRLREPVQ